MMTFADIQKEAEKLNVKVKLLSDDGIVFLSHIYNDNGFTALIVDNVDNKISVGLNDEGKERYNKTFIIYDMYRLEYVMKVISDSLRKDEE